MRVTTDFWVSALVRRAFSAGGFAAVVRRGSPEAGAVFVSVRDRLGDVRLFGPAPQSIYDDARPGERLFVELEVGATEDGANARLEREMRFDSDVWIVEIEADASLVGTLLPIASPGR